jgi:hypothetical protein
MITWVKADTVPKRSLQLNRSRETESCQPRYGIQTSHLRQEFGFKKLADYRLYCLDGANKVASAEWVEADDDEAAIEVAKQMHEGQHCELWQGRRLVARLDLRREA